MLFDEFLDILNHSLNVSIGERMEGRSHLMADAILYYEILENTASQLCSVIGR